MSTAGRPEHAVARLSRAISLRQDDPNLFRERAEASVLAKDYRMAIINFRKVISLRESQREAMEKRLGEVCYKHGTELVAEEKYKEALEMFDDAIGYDPKNKDISTRRCGFPLIHTLCL